MLRLGIADAERRMEELLNRVKRGEEIFIGDAEPRVKLAPLTVEERQRLRNEPPPRDDV